MAATERLRRVSRELLVGEVSVIFEIACRLGDVSLPAAFARGEFGSPGRRIECDSEADVGHKPTLFEFGLAAGDQQLTWDQVHRNSVQVNTQFVHLEGHRLPLVAYLQTPQRQWSASRQGPAPDLLRCAPALIIRSAGGSVVFQSPVPT